MFEHSPVIQLMVSNIKTYLREPEAIFWTYGFPLLMIIGLGIAFDTSVGRGVRVVVLEQEGSREIARALGEHPTIQVVIAGTEAAFEQLQRNRVLLVVGRGQDGGYVYHFDPSNPESQSARDAVNAALQTAAGRTDPVATGDRPVTAPGSRYVDFLVPGLIGMNLMGGGMWGVGFVLVDMRIKKLLKRILGTPMRRSQFLLSVVGNRLIFFVPEAFFLLLAAQWIFGVPIKGSLFSVVLVSLAGVLAFSGLGLLSASRAQRIETISGIMNVVMLPMWLCSGIFFSAERFPEAMQPFIQMLPLTQLINALRAVILEGQSLFSQSVPLLSLLAWASVSFFLALKWFRWN